MWKVRHRDEPRTAEGLSLSDQGTFQWLRVSAEASEDTTTYLQALDDRYDGR